MGTSAPVRRVIEVPRPEPLVRAVPVPETKPQEPVKVGA